MACRAEPPPSWSLSCSRTAALLHLYLQAWLIPPEEVTYLKRPNGELAVLGQGAR